MDDQELHAEEHIAAKIYYIRNQKVMLDSDLAELYGVETRRLNEQVRRNMSRFPEDFMFRISKDEYEILMSQNATSSWGGRRKLPYVFTEHGAVMLAAILKSEKATQASIYVVRVFVKLRTILSSYQELKEIVHQLEASTQSQLDDQQEQIQHLFKALKQLFQGEGKLRKPIGFQLKEGEAT